MDQLFAIIDNYLMIKMPKEVDHHETARISKTADEYIMNSKIKNVVFDFEETCFMDSSGIGIIMGRYRKVDCFGGKILAINCSKQIKKVLDMSGLYKYIELIN